MIFLKQKTLWDTLAYPLVFSNNYSNERSVNVYQIDKEHNFSSYFPEDRLVLFKDRKQELVRIIHDKPIAIRKVCVFLD